MNNNPMNYPYYPHAYSSYSSNYCSNLWTTLNNAPPGDSTHLHNNTMGPSAVPPQFGPGPSQTFQGILQFAGQLETNRQMCFMRIQQLERDKRILMEQNVKLDQENRELKAKIILHQKIMQQSSSPNSVDRHSLVKHSRESSRNDQLQQQNGSNKTMAVVPSNPFNVPNPQNAIIPQSVGSTKSPTSTAELPVQVLQSTLNKEEASSIPKNSRKAGKERQRKRTRRVAKANRDKEEEGEQKQKGNLVAQMSSNGENQESNPPILDDQTASNLMSASDDQTISESIPILSDQRISEDRIITDHDQPTTSNQEEGPSSSILTISQQEEPGPDKLGFKVPRSDFTSRQTDHSSLSTSDTDLISTSDKFIIMDKIINVSTTTKTAITTENVLQPVTEISNCHDQEDDVNANVGAKTPQLQMIVPIDLSLIRIPMAIDAKIDEARQNVNIHIINFSTTDHDQDVVFEDEICRNKFLPGLMKNEISKENEQIEQLEKEEEEEKNNIHPKMEEEPEDKREEQEPRMKKAKTEPAEAWRVS